MREQLLHLLTEAAELEHNLLCCYLYAAFSLKTNTGEGCSDAELQAVRRWRSLIFEVSREEMAHLVVVNNLIAAIGGTAHFNRPNFPVAPGYHPADVVVALRPFSVATLDHFIFLERPAGSPLKDGEGFEPPPGPPRTALPLALMPCARDYSTIGEFYDEIRACFTQLTAAIGERSVFVGAPGAQIPGSAAGLPGVETITDLASAIRAIDFIVTQGEGFTGDLEGSHFDRFSQIKSEYSAILQQRPDFEPARPAARDPVMRPSSAASGRTLIDHPPALALHDLANALYGQLLRLLTQCYGRQAHESQFQRLLLEAAVTLMRIFSEVASHLTTIRACAERSDVNAGVSFAMLRNTEPFAFGQGERQILAERLDELAEAVARSLPAAGSSAGALSKIAARFREFPG